MWQKATPESRGMDSTKLDALRDILAVRRTKAFLVVRHDQIVYEWYAPGHQPTKKHHTASLAKSLVGSLSLLIALEDGRIGLDDPAWKYIPSWKGDPERSRITIRHLATHSSGIEDAWDEGAQEAGLDQNQFPGWKGEFWRNRTNPRAFIIAKNEAPMIFRPGTDFHYSNPGYAMLSYAVAAGLVGAPESDIRALLKERIMDPLGVPESDWSIGYDDMSELDGLRLYANWGGGEYTARAVARVGQLMLRSGQLGENKRLLDYDLVKKASSYAATPMPDQGITHSQPASGLGWWVNLDGVWSSLPRDAFIGVGGGHQVLLVIPSLDLVVVRFGEFLGDTPSVKDFWSSLEEYLFNPLMDTIFPNPYPPSELIQGVDFAPTSSIVRDAIGSDNWPITWADDDNQYTSYGDGWGFNPKTERKLSLGFAKIIGPPTDFQGVNVRSPASEKEGDGETAPKASGMIMVDGVLYMWVRNLNNSQLAWSDDYGKTWEWGFRFETSFGAPTFLNFGKNYEGARDDYVYFYSNDGPSAYESYDHLVLGRVPKGRIRDRNAYEFFESLDKSGNPMWTKDIDKRGPVFTYRGHCGRADVVYNPGLNRYILALGYNMYGGWGIFEAPEPWGPWGTVFHTEYWGLGKTHGYRLPSKWISDDGRTMYLIFSGRTHDDIVYDAFSLQKLTFNVNYKE